MFSGGHMSAGSKSAATARIGGILDGEASALRLVARKAGEMCARKLFDARGNNAEIHLNEYELALACAAAAETVLCLETGAA